MMIVVMTMMMMMVTMMVMMMITWLIASATGRALLLGTKAEPTTKKARLHLIVLDLNLDLDLVLDLQKIISKEPADHFSSRKVFQKVLQNNN